MLTMRVAMATVHLFAVQMTGGIGIAVDPHLFSNGRTPLKAMSEALASKVAKDSMAARGFNLAEGAGDKLLFVAPAGIGHDGKTFEITQVLIDDQGAVLRGVIHGKDNTVEGSFISLSAGGPTADQVVAKAGYQGSTEKGDHVLLIQGATGDWTGRVISEQNGSVTSFNTPISNKNVENILSRSTKDVHAPGLFKEEGILLKDLPSKSREAVEEGIRNLPLPMKDMLKQLAPYLPGGFTPSFLLKVEGSERENLFSSMFAKAWESGDSAASAAIALLGSMLKAVPTGKELVQIVSALGVDIGQDFVIVGDSELGPRFDALTFVKTLENGNEVYQVAEGKQFFDGEKTWEAGSQFEKGPTGFKLIQGIVLEDKVPGLSWSGDGKMPVLYKGDSSGITAIGVDLKRVPMGTTLTFTGGDVKLRTGSIVEKSGDMVFRSGRIEVGKDGKITDLSHGTLFYLVGMKQWALFHQAEGQLGQFMKAQVDGSKFQASLDKYVVNAGVGKEASVAAVTGLILSGTVTKGEATFDLVVKDNVSIKLAMGKENASGTGLARVDLDGNISFEVKLTGDALVTGMGELLPTSETPSGTPIPEAFSGKQFNNNLFVKEYDAKENTALIRGEFWLLGTEKKGFGPGTNFQLLLGRSILDEVTTLGPDGTTQTTTMEYTQESAAWFTYDGADLKVTEGITGRDRMTGTIYTYKGDGSVDCTVTKNELGQWDKAFMAGSRTAVAAEEKHNILTGQHTLIIHALGSEEITIGLQPNEERGEGKFSFGWTILRNEKVRDWSKKLMMLPGAAMTPLALVALDEKGVSTEGAISLASGIGKSGAVLARNGTVLTGVAVNILAERVEMNINVVQDLLSVTGVVKPIESSLPKGPTLTFSERVNATVMPIFDHVVTQSEDMMAWSETVMGEQLDGLSATSKESKTAGISGAFAVQLAQMPGGFLTGIVGGRRSEEYVERSEKNMLGSFGAMGEEVYESVTGLIDPISQIEDSIDQHGNSVAWGSGVVQLGMSGMMLAGIVKAGGRGGALAWKKMSQVSAEGYTRISLPARGIRTAAATGSEMGLAALDTIMPGAHETAHGISWKRTEAHVLQMRAIERDFGVENTPGLRVLGKDGQRVVMEVRGEGARTLRLDELNRLSDVAAQKGLRLEIGFLDQKSFEVFASNVDNMNAVTAHGLKIFVGDAKGMLASARRFEETARVKTSEYESLELKKQEQYKTNETKLKTAKETQARFDLAKQEIKQVTQDFSNEISQGRMNHREFVAKLKETAPGFELGGELAGELRRAETSLKGNWEGAKGLSESQSVAGGIKGRLRSLGEKVRSGLEGFGLFRRKESGSNSQHRGLQERIAKGPAAEQATRAAEQATRAAEQATRAAVQYLDGKISEVGKTIQQLEGKRPLLQGEIQLAREGAERYRGRSESLGKLAGRYDQLLNGLEDRIVLRSSDSQTQEVVRPALDLTPQWKDGEVSKKGLLREWMRKGDDGLNPGYAPHPFNRAGPEPGGLLKEWQSRGVKPPQRLYAAHDSIEMARGYLPTAEHPSGINPNRINPNSRDAQARYLSPDPAVTVDELAAHGKVGRWMVEYEVQWENVRGIDQRTPQGAAKIGAAVDGNNYVDTSAPAHRGRMGGANALVRDSVRHEGGMVVSVLGDFDQVLKPTGRIIKMPADLVAIGESKVKASAGISNVSEAGPPAAHAISDGLGFKNNKPLSQNKNNLQVEWAQGKNKNLPDPLKDIITNKTALEAHTSPPKTAIPEPAPKALETPAVPLLEYKGPDPKMFKGLGDHKTSPWLDDPRVGVRVQVQGFRDGASFLAPKRSLEKRIARGGAIGRPDGLFVTTRSAMDKLVRDSGGDLRVIKKTIGIPEGEWNEPLVRVDVFNPLLHNARFPAGIESGANELFRWGGYTKGGMPEVIIDPVSPSDVFIRDLKAR
jgi:hypothetical protein